MNLTSILRDIRKYGLFVFCDFNLQQIKHYYRDDACTLNRCSQTHKNVQ